MEWVYEEEELEDEAAAVPSTSSVEVGRVLKLCPLPQCNLTLDILYPVLPKNVTIHRSSVCNTIVTNIKITPDSLIDLIFNALCFIEEL